MVIQLKVNGIRGEERVIKVCETNDQLKRITVLQLKRVITTELKLSFESRLEYTGKKMEDSSLLISHGIQHMSNIFVLPILPGGF